MSAEHVDHAYKYIRRHMGYEFGVIAPEHEADLLEGLCEGFVRANQIQIRVQPEAYPCCLSCGSYRYVDPENCKVFDWKRGRKAVRDSNCQTVWGAYPLDKRKRGTCIDLACMLCAIFREKEDDRGARVVIEHQFGPIVGYDPDGSPQRERLDGQYHAMVMRGDGDIVDPTHQVIEQAKALAVGGCVEQECGCVAGSSR